MPSLIEKTPCDGLLPLAAGQMTLSEVRPGPITSVMPFAGQEAAAGAALGKLGLGWPAPNRALAKGGTAILWTGRGQAFLLGAALAGLDGIAALTDQSDAWAVMRLEGPGTEAALARLVAIDLRAAAFPTGQVARTGLNHMMSVLWRDAPGAVTIMVFRSMAATAVHELHTAMRSVEARAHH